MVRSATILALVIMALPLVGCEQAAYATVEQVSQGITQVTIPGRSGSTAANPQFLDELKTFPVPQGFGLGAEGLGTAISRGDVVAVASWTGSGSVQGIVDFYGTILPQKGWGLNVMFSSDRSAQLTYTRGESQATTVVEKAGNMVGIRVVIGRVSDYIPTPIPTATVPPSTATPTRSAVPGPGARARAEIVTPAATFTPEPLRSGDPASVPAELRGIPVPDGFELVSGSPRRAGQGVDFAMASADWFGSTPPGEVGAHLRAALGRDWNEDGYLETSDAVSAQYASKRDPRLTLLIEVSRQEYDTVVHMNLVRSR